MGPILRRPKLSINPLISDSPEPNEFGIVHDDPFDPRHRQPLQIRAGEQTFPTDLPSGSPPRRLRAPSTRSPAEHKLLRGAIGRAMTCESAERGDLLAVVVPRSKRFHELAVRRRAAEGASRAGLLILTVDRAGMVDGLPRSAPTEWRQSAVEEYARAVWLRGADPSTRFARSG